MVWTHFWQPYKCQGYSGRYSCDWRSWKCGLLSCTDSFSLWSNNRGQACWNEKKTWQPGFWKRTKRFRLKLQTFNPIFRPVIRAAFLLNVGPAFIKKECYLGRYIWSSIKNWLYYRSVFWCGLSFPSRNPTGRHGGLQWKRIWARHPQYWEFSVPDEIWAGYCPEMHGNLGIGCISDSEPQPLIVRSHLGNYAITTVDRINNETELIERAFHCGSSHFLEMSGAGSMLLNWLPRWSIRKILL